MSVDILQSEDVNVNSQVPNSSNGLSGYLAIPMSDQWLRKRFKRKFPELVASVDFSISKEKLTELELYTVQHQVRVHAVRVALFCIRSLGREYC